MVARAIGFRVEIQRGYLTGATALHYWWNREVETRVGWSDIALGPLRWDKFREQRGDGMVALG